MIQTFQSSNTAMTIKSLLGQGGMGYAYLVEYDNREAVLKVAKPGFDDYIVHEARILGRLRHPNIISVLPFPGTQEFVDTVADSAGEHTCLLMEYKAGGSLFNWLRTGTLARGNIIAVIQEISLALDAAHAQSIVHLDVKPSNILFDARHRHAVLSDFNVAEMENHKRQAEDFGTPLYIASERLMGITGSAAMDIYSLGVVAAEMCLNMQGLGHLLSYNPLTLSFSPGESVSLPVKQPDPRWIEEARENLITALDRLNPAVRKVLLKALHPTPELRFRSATSFSKALADALPRWSWRSLFSKRPPAQPIPLPLPVTDESTAPFLVTRPIIPAHERNPALKLSLMDDQGAVHEWLLGDGETRIGRNRDNDILLDNHFISRLHARIARTNGIYEIQVMSRNRLVLNGRVIEDAPAPIGNGDIVEIGPYRMQVKPLNGTEYDLYNAWSRYLQVRDSDSSAALGTFIAEATGCALRLGAAREQSYAALMDTREMFADTPTVTRTPVIVWHGRLDHSQLNDFWREVKAGIPAGIYFAILILPLMHRQQDPVIAFLRDKAQADAIDLIFLTNDDLMAMIQYRQRQPYLRNLMLNQMSLGKISPYKTEGSVTGGAFFGREREIREICDGLSSASFALIGTRRIGKTSILHRLAGQELGNAGYQTLYYNGQGADKHDGLKNYAIFLKRLLAGYHKETGLHIDAQSITEFLDRRPDRQPLVLLIDEADALLNADQACDWRIYGELRSLSQSGACQSVLAGEAALRQMRLDDATPFFNFAREVTVGRFDRIAVNQLVVQPMEQIGIVLDDPDAIVATIFNFTGGHPNIVQRLCARLVDRLDSNFRRQLTVEDAQHVINDPTFQRDDFLSTYFQRTSLLERIIMVLLAQASVPLTRAAIRDQLKAQGIDVPVRQVEDALQLLTTLRGLLTYGQDGYAGAVGGFRSVIGGSILATELLEELIEEYHEQMR